MLYIAIDGGGGGGAKLARAVVQARLKCQLLFPASRGISRVKGATAFDVAFRLFSLGK